MARANNYFNMASNENPLKGAPRALKAMNSALENVAFHPEASSFEPRQRVAEYSDVRADTPIFGAGADAIIHCLDLAKLEYGDEIVRSYPSFVQDKDAATLMYFHAQTELDFEAVQ